MAFAVADADGRDVGFDDERGYGAGVIRASRSARGRKVRSRVLSDSMPSQIPSAERT